MAKIENLKPFKKGKSGNPSGRKKLPEHLRVVAKYTKDEINALFSKYLRMDVFEMKAAMKADNIPAVEAWIASGISKGISNGDLYNLSLMCERMFGKTKAEEMPKPPPIESESHIAAPVIDEDEFEIERYVVLMNKDGKFEHARPRLVQAPKP